MVSPLLAQTSLNTFSTLAPSRLSPSWVSIWDKTCRARADWTTFVRSRQSMQLTSAKAMERTYFVRNAPFCSRMASPWSVHKYPMLSKSSSLTSSEMFSQFIPWHLAWKSKSLYLVSVPSKEVDVRDIGTSQFFDQVTETVGHDPFFASLFGKVDNGLLLAKPIKLTYDRPVSTGNVVEMEIGNGICLVDRLVENRRRFHRIGRL